MKKVLRGLVLGMVMMVGATSTTAFASTRGNGNDGCQINLEGHKNGQSDEHKIDYMTYQEFETYLDVNGFSWERMSNNIESNGWITYHIYDECGKQIEVVHVRGQKEEVVPPVEDGTEDDQIMVNPPVGEGEDNIEVAPPVEEGEDNFLTPNLPVGEGEDNIEVMPPVGEGEDNIEVDQPATEGGDLPEIGIDTPATENGDLPEIGVDVDLPNVGDGTEEDKIEVPTIEENVNNEEVPTIEENVNTEVPNVEETVNNQEVPTLPYTGGTDSLMVIMLSFGMVGTGMSMFKRK